jgi:putative acyl-CoA dehydrogenase
LNLPLQEALAWHHPGYDRARFEALGAEAGSAEMQVHARLANFHSPVLHAHDRFGHRIDQVEFHPSYHALMGSALRHRLHATPWTEGAGGHIERAAAFMLFTELEPSILCPVSMSYAVTPALRAMPALFRRLAAQAGQHAVRRALPAPRAEVAVTMGMGMTEKQGGSDVRANSTRAEFEADDAWGKRLPHHRPQVVHVGADVRCLPGAGADAYRPELLLPAAAAARRQRQRTCASSG